jgi:hypothetical protein
VLKFAGYWYLPDTIAFLCDIMQVRKEFLGISFGLTFIVIVYVVCSKSIEPYFFPNKPMKRGRLPSVEMWRGHSCAVVNFFPPAESVSRWQSAYE